MKKISLEGAEYRFSRADMPILIHGTDASGASLYTISLAAGLYARGAELLFLCGYPMAEEEFARQAGPSDGRAVFFTKDHVAGFLRRLEASPEAIVVAKNAELFGDDVFIPVLARTDVVVSGDIARCPSADRILGARFRTNILFSGLGTLDVPKLEKYAAYFASDDRNGTTGLI